MGTVYRARRILIGDIVAVKVLDPDHAADPKAVERFHREAQTAARLKHPNVVKVYDFGVSGEGLNYMVMELAEGESLRSLIELKGTLTETDAAEIIRQVCAALDEAHRHNVIHRDIKPENILVRTLPGGLQVKVFDFGIAALRDAGANRLTRPGSIMGTPHYMSPEHCIGAELDGRSDIYSLGIVLFEMLTGVVPFDSHISTAVVVKQVNEPPPALRKLNPSISPGVESVALHALEKERDARPQTAGEMAREMMAAVNCAGRLSTHPKMVAAPGSVTPEQITPRMASISMEKVTLESSRGAATPLGASSMSGEAPAKTGSGGGFVLPIFSALLLLLSGCGGLWWYSQKAGNEKVVTTSDSAGNSQQPSAVSGQPTMTDQNATVSPSASPGPPESPAPGVEQWELISDQTIRVAEAANALGAANRQMAVISPGGQLALGYREGRFFGNGLGADLRVYGPEKERVSYLIFVRNDSAGDWERIDINQKGFLRGEAGHDMGHHGVRQATQLMIRNNGNTDLSIDAVAVVYKDRIQRMYKDRIHRKSAARPRPRTRR
jgi:serine/threonine protein kinase